MAYVVSGFSRTLLSRAFVSRTLRAFGARIALAGALLTVVVAWPVGAQQDQPPTFRGVNTTVSVDVVVRDQAGAVVRGLTAADFTILEDGKPQKIDTFTFQEITDQPRKPLETTSILAGVEERLQEEVQRAAGAAPSTATAATVSEAEASDLAGRRLVVLLFDISSMQPEDVQRAVDSGMKYARESMAASDLVSVVTIGSTLNVLSDFTSEREEVLTALQGLA